MTLACLAGGLYFYVMFLETRNRQVLRRAAELERENEALREALERVEDDRKDEEDAEAWPDVIEGDGYSLK